ncbi:klaroid protein-like [Helicoverpa armigera]|uniref:klaroid protein-like n=1 Tax=Helicoverpa armigera TaxID=29058 RepID=UPI003082C711
MENPTVSGLRSRSRSKTPFLRSSCDRENCVEGEEHTHQKSGRKTPVKRSTPVKQLNQPTIKVTSETITEEEEHTSEPVHQTRRVTRNAAHLIRTSDYSSEESLDRLKGRSKEVEQNEINSQYERVSTSSRGYKTLSDVTLSPIYTSHGVTHDRSSRIGSPSSYSACSTDSSFAEQALADASLLLEVNPDNEHLPSRLYKMAREYWNKYPKTDYTYSHLSKDRVELAPGQVAMPNMSRRSLSQFRVQGPNTSLDELDRLSATTSWTTSSVRRRYTSIDSSDDETSYPHHNGSAHTAEQRWWITRLLISIVTTITTSTKNTYRSIVGPSHRYPYTDRRPAQASLLTRSAAALATPFYWIYTMIKSVVTTTTTTITETLSPNHVEVNKKYIAQNYKNKTVAKKRWWPWFLLLLLPAVAYGYYNYAEKTVPPEELIVDTYKPPQILQDPDLSKRMAALEGWAVNVDSRLKYFDQKLSRFDNLEAQIEQYSLKYLQQNLIQVFNENDNAGVLAAKLKEYFDKEYVSKDQMQAMSQEIHERLISSWKPDMDEDKIRQMVQEYLAVFERRQMEIIRERVREYVRDVEIHHSHTGIDIEAVKRIVAGMLDVYDADKTGLVDYALESAGGQVISTKCTELYQIKTKQYSILGLPVWWVYTSPRFALTPGAMPAECWAFQGFPGYLVVRTYAIIEVTGFSLEHMSRLLAVEGKIESAPKNFSVYGLHGEMDPEPHLFGDYQYNNNGTAIQYFPVQYPKTTDIGGVKYPVAYDIIELRVESNHGNPTYTCVYRFRVHGNPLSDIRRATEDSIKDSET